MLTNICLRDINYLMRNTYLAILDTSTQLTTFLADAICERKNLRIIEILLRLNTDKMRSYWASVFKSNLLSNLKTGR